MLNSSGSALANTAQGSYTYDPTHVHAVTGVGSGSTGYAAAYDATGDQTCRAVGGAGTCAGSNPTGQQLGYDGLRRLVSWQGSIPQLGSPPTEAYAYDGAGQRVWQQATQPTGPASATTTTSTYVLGVEEVTTTAVTGQQPSTTTTSYYPLPGGVSASRDSSGLVYQASDALGTPIAAVNLASGAGVVGEQLRAPYGQARYAFNAATSGGMHTTFGFTGQREDTQAPGSSGLDYFGARYYDPVIGRFTSADDVHPGLSDPVGLDNFGYVGGQVESATDPSGHFRDDPCPNPPCRDVPPSGITAPGNCCVPNLEDPVIYSPQRTLVEEQRLQWEEQRYEPPQQPNQGQQPPPSPPPPPPPPPGRPATQPKVQPVSQEWEPPTEHSPALDPCRDEGGALVRNQCISWLTDKTISNYQAEVIAHQATLDNGCAGMCIVRTITPEGDITDVPSQLLEGHNPPYVPSQHAEEQGVDFAVSQIGLAPAGSRVFVNIISYYGPCTYYKGRGCAKLIPTEYEQRLRAAGIEAGLGELWVRWFVAKGGPNPAWRRIQLIPLIP